MNTNSMKIRVRATEAFTLIELMIVVAIIGILAAIAIPNFLKFQCKSKQSEAKTNLAGLFTAEKAFFGEGNTYSSDLVAVNWVPDGSPLYIIGFATAGGASVPGMSGYNTGRSNTMVAEVISSPARYSTVKCHDLGGTNFAGTNLPTSVASAQTFTAGAAGDIDTDVTVNASALDTWSIDEHKVLTIVNNDCTTSA